MSIATDTQNTTLYDRLGRDEGISKLVEDIVAAHLENPEIQARYLPLQKDPERMETAKQHLRTFLSSGTGGPGQYEGRSMPEIHRGMNISAAEYMAAVDDIMGALDKNNIDEESRKEILAIAYSLKDEIMRL